MHVRQSACSGDCHKCSGCGAVQEKMLISADNAIHAQVGDLVKISASSSRVLLSAAVLYLVPLILFFIGYLVGAKLGFAKELCGCLAFVLGFCVVVIYDRKFLSRKKQSYTITGMVKNSEEE